MFWTKKSTKKHTKTYTLPELDILLSPDLWLVSGVSNGYMTITAIDGYWTHTKYAMHKWSVRKMYDDYNYTDILRSWCNRRNASNPAVVRHPVQQVKVGDQWILAFDVSTENTKVIIRGFRLDWEEKIEPYYMDYLETWTYDNASVEYGKKLTVPVWKDNA